MPSLREILGPSHSPGSREGSPLSRRDVLKLASTSGFSLTARGAVSKIEVSNNLFELWDIGAKIYDLEVIFDSVHVTEQRVSLNRKEYNLTFLSCRTDIQNLEDRENNPYSRATEVKLTFHDRESAIQTGTFIRGMRLVGDRLKSILKTGSFLGAIGLLQKQEQLLPPKGRIGHLPWLLGSGVLLVLSCGALIKGASDLYAKVRETPEGETAVATLASLPTPNPTATTEIKVQVTPKPEIPTNFSAQTISIDYLLQNGQLIANQSNTDIQPQPAPVPTAIFPEANRNITPTSYTGKVFNITTLDFKNPTHVFKYAIAQGARQGTDGGVTYYQTGIQNEVPAFSGLSLYRERLKIPTDTQFQGEYRINQGYPRGLVLKNGAGITIVGKNQDGNILIAFEENEQRETSTTFFQPRMRLATITVNELQALIQKGFLKNLKYDSSKPDELIYKDNRQNLDRIVGLNTLDRSLMDLLNKEIGILWAEKLPKHINDKREVDEWNYFPEPVIHAPNPDIDALPEGLDLNNLDYATKINYTYLRSTRSITAWAFDKTTKRPVLTAHYDSQKKEWKWGEPTSRDLADALIFKNGAALTLEWFDENYTAVSAAMHKKYLEVIETFSNTGVIHDAFDWQGFEPERGKISEGNKQYITRQITALKNREIKNIRAHALIDPRWIPNWLKDGVRNGSISKDTLIEQMRQHIRSLMLFVGSQVTEWIVVNEPYRHYSEVDDIFQNVIGEEYVDIAFQIAREVAKEANLKVRLILNDTLNHTTLPTNHSVYNVPQNNTTAQTKRIVDRLKTKGLIDAVGLQMHLDGANAPDWEDVITTMKSYGVSVEVTEFDVNMRNVSGTKEERLAKQAAICSSALNAALSSGVCNGLTVWDIGDRYSWGAKPQFYGGPNSDVTLFDDNLNPKPALKAMNDVYKDRLASLPS